VNKSALKRIPAKGYSNKEVRVLYVGRFIPGKEADLAVRAFSIFCKSHPGVAEFDLIGGKTYLRDRIDDLIESEDVSDSVRTYGWMDHEEVKQLYSDYDVFLFPSLRDSDGTVVFESLSAGLPVICLDLGGPPKVVGKNGGIIVPAQTETEGEVVEGLALALERICGDGELLVRLKEAALQRAKELTWENTVHSVCGLITDHLDIHQ
jgi:glycosyltransferase involved in cell wall biosynthesis